MRLITMLAVVAAVLASAACGGSGSDAFSEDDVARILGPPSATSAGSSWVRHVTSELSMDELRAVLRRDGVPGAVADALQRAGLRRHYEWGWRSRRGAEAFATGALFGDANEATQGLEPLQEFSYNWVSTQPADDLGESATAGRSEGAAGYTWRRDNLILGVAVFRSRGPTFDYEASARAYAHELDGRAKARGG